MRYYIALGSNIGEREKFLNLALEEMAKIGIIEKKSSIYESEPFGNKNQQNYLNAVCVLNYKDDVTRLLKQLKEIEKSMGRKDVIRWGPRIIDLDIIDYDGKKVETNDLAVPHPEMYNRNFVLIPLAEITPEYRDRKGRSIKQIIKKCPAGFIEQYKNQW